MNLYNDDCLNVLDLLPEESVDLVITDCPYHIVSGGCSNEQSKFEPGGMLNHRKDSNGNTYVGGTESGNLGGAFDELDPHEYVKKGKLFKHNDIEFSEWLPKAYRVLKPGTHCYVMINARNLKELQQAAEDAGFEFQQLIVWDKGNATLNKWYMNAYELILMLKKGPARKINDLGTKNILYVPNVIKCKRHPTEKPVGLMKILVKNSSEEGDTVLDPFMGVGSTGVACAELNRDFIGIEIDERYYNIAKERMDCPCDQMSLFSDLTEVDNEV